MGGGVRQGDALVLRGDIAEVCGDPGQLCSGTQAPVDVGTAAAPQAWTTPPDDQLSASGNAGGLELRGHAGIGCELEERLDLGVFGPGPHELRGRARPPRTSDRASTTIDLPAPVSPVIALKPGPRLEHQPLDEEPLVADRDLEEHGKRHPNVVRRHLRS